MVDPPTFPVPRHAFFAVLVAILFFRAPYTALAATTTSDALHYEIADSKTRRVVSNVWGWTETTDDAPHTIVVISQTTFPQGGEWYVRARFTRDDPPRCLTVDSTRSDKSGALIASSHTRWVPDLYPTMTRPMPPDTYPLDAPVGYVLSQLGLGKHRQRSFHTVLGNTPTQIDLWLDGSETITVPAGTFDCYRIRMRANADTLFPNLPAFLRPVLSFFIPTYTLWLTRTEPQMFVQFIGQMGPPGSPELLIRLLQVRAPHH